MTTLKETKQLIEREPQHWCVHLMDFVDDFRYYKDPRAVAEPFALTDERNDALLASTAETLCDELGVEPPIVESPLRFRIRKIFVLENFLSRV